jgi:hypothetical protein
VGHGMGSVTRSWRGNFIVEMLLHRPARSPDDIA